MPNQDAIESQQAQADTLQPEPRYVADVTVKAIDALDAITGDGMVNPYAAARRVVSTGMSCQEIGE